jgi:hypothetical protein
MGNPLDINSATLLGPVRSLSFGLGQGGNFTNGYKDSNFGQPVWRTIGTGWPLTGGVSYGWGKTYKGWLDY